MRCCKDIKIQILRKNRRQKLWFLGKSGSNLGVHNQEQNQNLK